jgi:LPXTG-motif cell wall-anchored protein
VTVADPPAAGPTQLPRTGGGGDMPVAYLGTAFVVGGIGLIGTLRRRRQLT